MKGSTIHIFIVFYYIRMRFFSPFLQESLNNMSNIWVSILVLSGLIIKGCDFVSREGSKRLLQAVTFFRNNA